MSSYRYRLLSKCCMLIAFYICLFIAGKFTLQFITGFSVAYFMGGLSAFLWDEGIEEDKRRARL